MGFERKSIVAGELVVGAVRDSRLEWIHGMSEDIAGCVRRLWDKIANAADRAGRDSRTIVLVAVTKTVEVDAIEEACASGIKNFGENYVQEFKSKREAMLSRHIDLNWHFIGHLQTNKVREVVGNVNLIQSVDSEKLAAAIAGNAIISGGAQAYADVLLEVKLDPSPDKYGFDPSEVLDFAATLNELGGLRVLGLMGMAPFGSDPEQARPYFRSLRRLFEQLPPSSRQVLSMGMTGDFEVAVEEGATMLRIGAALFGHRPRN